MKWSKFIFRTEASDGYILLNTTNTAIVFLDKDTYSRMELLLHESCAKKDSAFNDLVNMNFLIDEKRDEQKELYDETCSELGNFDTLKIVLLGTTGCNFCCSYCYENGIDRSHLLTEDIVDNLYQYVKDILVHNSFFRHVYLLMFGGEPTLRWKELVSAAERIKELCSLLSVGFKSGITTNGYLLTKEKSDELIKLNCNMIQITLDGPPKVHDRRRKLISGKGTFYQIIENMKNLLATKCVPSIDVRINIDRDNAESIEELLLFLSTSFSTNELNISLGVVSKTLDNPEGDEHDKKNTFLIDEATKCICDLIPLVEHYGFKTPDFYSFDGICIAKSKYSFALNPDGNIYRCLSMVGRDSLSVGNIRSIDPMKILESFQKKAAYDWCIKRNCEFLPLCHAGCKFDAIINNNSVDVPACKYDQYCTINRFLLQRLLEKGM